ncbi:hypothetical protein SISSUDRAFT_1133444 [Sistotremastrum suecicum HHB10207 ss-3]|uniref:MYND-type domain-containing protein n=1 Tax=Sistotremastrum suecicum HHB10207 ss-3 TaxID=1314776 RepID=A0A165X7M9_9AGAM|nr:hypothetical protein SISSUDRAFT_1133444 [Sistotremastrum suecicum HHB10207 ss-3]
MRESNFAFPAQNKACVCISSQLYDRRALDTNSPLPLFNSLTHLTYLTSTSPRIREILITDGGLERLVRLLRDFCVSPPPPENPALFYGLSVPSPSIRQPRAPSQFPLTNYDKHAAYRFSLAFQCIVNIGVRGSEPIRSRVVQAGALDVVTCLLETWLTSKGFSTVPGASASGQPRESRESRAQRRETRHRELQLLQAELQRPRNTSALEDSEMNEPDSADVSSSHTPTEPNQPINALTTATRPTDRSTFNEHTAAHLTTANFNFHPPHDHRSPARRRSSRSNRPSFSQASGLPGPSSLTTPTPSSADSAASASASDASPSHSPSPGAPSTSPHAVGIVDNDPSSPTASNGHIAMPIPMNGDFVEVNMLNLDPEFVMRDGFEGVGVNVGNDDLAMGAPPGAPGAAIDIQAPAGTGDDGRITPLGDQTSPSVDAHRGGTTTPRNIEETTPRAVNANLPGTTPTQTLRSHHHSDERTPAANTRFVPPAPLQPSSAGNSGGTGRSVGDEGPYREEDVLLALQLLAYLSKYPHVRQAFYKPRNYLNGPGSHKGKEVSKEELPATKDKDKEANGSFIRFVAGQRNLREKEKEVSSSTTSTSSRTSWFQYPPPDPPTADIASRPTVAVPGTTNVFSLVERFTFIPSPAEINLPNPPPMLPADIHYWASVIMRNACRKDESRGGTRQCANMLCGRWERFPREFAKCRRCRKAKYCGKECQSRAWQEGHRFWCSAKEGDDATANLPEEGSTAGSGSGGGRETAGRERERRSTRETNALLTAAGFVAPAPPHHHHHHHPHPPPTHPLEPTQPRPAPSSAWTAAPPVIPNTASASIIYTATPDDTPTTIANHIPRGAAPAIHPSIDPQVSQVTFTVPQNPTQRPAGRRYQHNHPQHQPHLHHNTQQPLGRMPLAGPAVMDAFLRQRASLNPATIGGGARRRAGTVPGPSTSRLGERDRGVAVS